MEQLSGMKRSMRCAEVSEANLGQELTLMAWVQKQRDLGSLIFISLRDRSGEMQVVVDEDSPEGLLEKASHIRSEYVIAVRGIMRERSNPNKEIKTGLWEIHAQEIRILSKSETPPFYIEEESDVKESLRLEHRYLDLRRPSMQRHLMLRSDVTNFTRNFFANEGFIDIETPILGKSTPEGARDYLVPSRIFPGQFFALPQSPQLFKQLLMASGFDRYIQIARCFRDEDLRADRQPEFTQIDLEMSFVDKEDVMALTERYLKALFHEVKGLDFTEDFQRITYQDAMAKYGSDKPDLRFGLEIQDLSAIVEGIDFVVFSSALEAGGKVQAIVVPEAATMTRREIDKLQDFIKTYGAKGLAWLAVGDEWRGSIMKFMNDEILSEIKSQTGAQNGDLILIVADGNIDTIQASLGALRNHIARERQLYSKDSYKFVWVTDFPLLEWDEETERFAAKHHPFTMPEESDLELLESKPADVKSKAYDIVLNGYELGGGSIRIHDSEIQEKLLSLLGFTKESAYENFSFLLDAFRYGLPPHGGIAIGLDRLLMLLLGTDNIREVVAFPKVQTSADLMTKAPGTVSVAQLDELGIAIQALAVEPHEGEQ